MGITLKPKCDFLPRKIKNLMRKLIEESRDGMERGFFTCKENEKLTFAPVWTKTQDGDFIIGGKVYPPQIVEKKFEPSYVAIPKEANCPPPTTKIGSFHTHPLKEPSKLKLYEKARMKTTEPSSDDLITEVEFVCIGSPRKIAGQETNLACYDPLAPWKLMPFFKVGKEWMVHKVEAEPICEEELEIARGS